MASPCGSRKKTPCPFSISCAMIFLMRVVLPGAWSAEDVQAAAPLHVAYGDFFTCLYIRAEDDIIGHGDRPTLRSVLCYKCAILLTVVSDFNRSAGLFQGYPAMKPKSAAKAHEFLPVTPTEEEILKTMSTYRYMTALDVAYSLFSPKSLTHVRSILTRLAGGQDYKERQCLYRFPWPTGKAGNPERIFTLGAAGREIVQRLGIPVTWYYRPSKTGRLNSSYLAHQLLVTRFVICACRFTSEHPDYTLADVRLCYDLERSLRNRAGEAVVPDAWLHFARDDGRKFPVLVEIDRGIRIPGTL